MSKSSKRLIEIMQYWEGLLQRPGFDKDKFYSAMETHWVGLVAAVRPLAEKYPSIEQLVGDFPKMAIRPRQAAIDRYNEAEKMLLQLLEPSMKEFGKYNLINISDEGVIEASAGKKAHEYSKAVIAYYWAVESGTETILGDLARTYESEMNYHMRQDEDLISRKKNPVREILIAAFKKEGDTDRAVKKEIIREIDLILSREKKIVYTRDELRDKFKLLGDDTPAEVRKKIQIPGGLTTFAFDDLAEAVWSYYHHQLGIRTFSRWSTFLRTSLGRENYPN